MLVTIPWLVMIASFLRSVFGFVLACLAAAATKVGFVITPLELLALEPSAGLEQLARAGVLMLAVATQSAIFAAPFAVIVIVLGHRQRIRGWPYYVFSGLLISLLGFATLYITESAGHPTIGNAYAAAAYTFAGMIGGYVYWAVSGRGAGGSKERLRSDFVVRRGETDKVGGERKGDAHGPLINDTSVVQVREAKASSAAGETVGAASGPKPNGA